MSGCYSRDFGKEQFLELKLNTVDGDRPVSGRRTLKVFSLFLRLCVIRNLQQTVWEEKISQNNLKTFTDSKNPLDTSPGSGLKALTDSKNAETVLLLPRV
jgi:hypothetical protein